MSQGGSGFLLAIVSAGFGAAGATALYTARPDLLQKAGNLMSTNASETLINTVKKAADAAKAAIPSSSPAQEGASPSPVADVAPPAPSTEVTSVVPAAEAAESVAVVLPEVVPAAAQVAVAAPASASRGGWVPISGRSASVLVVLTGGAVAAAYVLDDRAKARIDGFLTDSRIRIHQAYEHAAPIARRAAAGTLHGLSVAWAGCRKAAVAAATHARPAAQKAGTAIGAAASKAYSMVVPPPLAPMQQEDPSAAADPGALNAEAKDEGQPAETDADAGAGAEAGVEAGTEAARS